MFTTILTVLGLSIFEIISSIDNAVVNADVLGTIKNEKAKKFFLFWGILFAIFVVRGFLPSLIIFLANPSIGLWGSLQMIWSNNPQVRIAIEMSTPILMIGGGMFLLLLWVHWLFMEDKKFGLPFEYHVQYYGAVWFYAIASFLLVGMLVMIDKFVTVNPMNLALAAAVGFCAFFITQGFKENAEKIEGRMIEAGGKSAMSDWAKVIFLEIIDLTFSIDGVIGAFAFTTSVILILIGNGIGSLVVRQLTVGNVDRIRSYDYLKNGAMYSIGFLGSLMILEAFGVSAPAWISPIVTISLVGFFLQKSIAANKAKV